MVLLLFYFILLFIVIIKPSRHRFGLSLAWDWPNADKTHLMTVGTSRRLQLQEQRVVVVMDGCVLQESVDKVETLLGSQIEPSLKWHKQVEELLKKLKKRLTALENLRFIIPFQFRKTITEGIFTSVLA